METTPVQTDAAADFEAMTAGIPDVLGGGSEVESPGAPAQTPSHLDTITPEYVADLANMPFEFYGSQPGREFWRLSEQQKNHLGVVLHPIVKPFLVRHPELDMTWIALVATLGGILMPRLAQEKALLARETSNPDSTRAPMATANVSASLLWPEKQEAASHGNQTDWFSTPVAV
ncbi:MAG: hypothetical protein JSS87_12805 [Acidobacteria bacterium]|nr:hypothetical protein [Acidobacteriota bacterium]